MNQARLRRWAAWGARVGPDWFVSVAPAVIGCVAFLFAHRARRAVMRNLRLVLGPRELVFELSDAVSTFVGFARNLTESLNPERFSARRRLVIRGRQRAADLLEQGGVILATAHVGPWDDAAMTFPRLSSRPVMMLMAHELDPQAQGVQDQVRREEKVRVVRLGASPFSGLATLEHLGKGGVVVAQLDRLTGTKAPIPTELFGAPFLVSPGLLRLAGLTRCPILPVFMARSGGARLVLVGDPITVQARPSREELQRAAQSFVSQLEEHLRSFATQWYNFVD